MKNILLLLSCFFAGTILAQENNEFKPTLKFKGFTQMYFSAEDADYGFSMRRARIIPYGNITDNITYLLQFSFDKQKPAFLDAKINFKLKEQFQITAGQFAAPGARSGAIADRLFSTTKMNLIQRSMVTQNWNTAMNMKGYRDVGVQLHGFLFDKKLYYASMIANPKGADLFTPSVKTADNQGQNNGVKNWTRIEYFPVEKIAVGGFFGFSDYKDTVNNTSNSYGAHIIVRDEKYRFFAEYIAGENTSETNFIADYKYNGFFVEAGYVFNKKIMPVLGIDHYVPVSDSNDKLNVKSYTNYSVGLNYFVNKNIKLMANYITRTEKMASDPLGNEYTDYNNNLLLVCLQLYFHQ